MIRNMTDIFRSATPAVNRNFVQKVEVRLVPVTLPPTQTFDKSIMPF